ncbi:MAG: biotin--[acetyl-CoA-carboxylase] ligase [Gemmatimonadota bacterium]|nr:MAG: biotin--[acetyl-CoA-carboxylase] ligase [Gemmatimonadota bacterium]
MTSYDGVPLEELARRLAAPRCLALGQVSSTLDKVHELAGDGAPAGTVVLAEEQLAGRGRMGRRWLSPPGTGIWLGYLARPECAGEHGLMALRVGLAVVASLGDLGVAARLKWPNDVLVSDRKLGGILCEARWAGRRVAWVAVGVGVNVHRPLPEELEGAAITLDEIRSDVSRVAVLERLVPRLHVLPDAAQLTAEEQATYARHDWLRGRSLTGPVVGIAMGIDHEGALLVETEHGVERILGGSVAAA